MNPDKKTQISVYLFGVPIAPPGCSYLIKKYMECLDHKKTLGGSISWTVKENELIQIIAVICRVIQKNRSHAGIRVHLSIAVENIFTALMALIDELKNSKKD